MLDRHLCQVVGAAARRVLIAFARLSLFAGLLAASDAALAQFPLLGVFKPTGSQFYADQNNDKAVELIDTFGRNGDIALTADLYGSGVKVPVVFRAGQWQFDVNGDGTADVTINFGQAGDIPAVGDIDGDGKDDLILYRNGTWLYSTKGDGKLSGQYTFAGIPGVTGFTGPVTPMVADLDGDGKADLVLFSGGVWAASTNRSSLTNTYFFGALGDYPLAFNYSGADKNAELVILHGTTWTVRSVKTNANVATFTLQGTGSGDRPLYYGIGNPPPTLTRVEAARFLGQATFGPTDAEIQKVMSLGYAKWIDQQVALPVTSFPAMPVWPANRPQPPTGVTWPTCTYAFYTTQSFDAASPCNCVNGTGIDQCQRDVYGNGGSSPAYPLQLTFLSQAIAAPDQLRQRVAWALAQILVTSSLQDPLVYPMRNYQQRFRDLAFGRFEDLLTQITLDPWMGNYLDMVNNAKAIGTRQPNENYAREIMQLFSIGLWELKGDGTRLLDAGGNPIPTYSQTDITELARALTGWTYPTIPGRNVAWNSPVYYNGPMISIEGALNGTGTTNYHDVNAKTVMGVVQPAGTRAAADVTWAVQLVANHPNTGPYIGKQLIQLLVTSNPSPAYVQRVVTVWNNNGAGVRGDLKAVVKAVLLDPEARTPRGSAPANFGKLKEPVLALTSFMRQIGGVSDGVSLRTGSNTMSQSVFNSPTVFNYYNQDYVVPGTTLAGPPFQIFDATNYFSRVNYFYNLIYNATCDGTLDVCGPAPDGTVNGSTGTKINYAPLKALATDPTGLVKKVNDLLLFGEMTDAQLADTINAVAAVTLSATPTQQQLLDRARMAVYLLAISPKFQVEH